MENTFIKVLVYNIIGIVLISFLSAILYNKSNDQFGLALNLLVVNIIFVIGNAILAVYYQSKGENELGKSLLTCSGLMLLIGPATCFTTLSVLG